ncbi:AraC family transcriptional regulator [Leptospira sp. 201903070]|uniref:AraC family transcriptional regulator n=2 Tax=Leptospira ainlahdjerensis TaxID=2810033 RepID=A0ABS2UDY6_9LEPT|nr:AraC family transcriptional regulator [Leptospira ainlahdjerensis]
MIWIGFSSALSLLLSFSEFLGRKRNQNNSLLSGIFLCISIILSYGWAYSTNWISEYPLLLFYHIPALILIGPMYHRWVSNLTRSGDSFRSFSKVEFLVLVFLILSIAPFYFFPPDLKLQIVTSYAWDKAGLIQRFLFGIGLITFSTYLILSIHNFFSTFRFKDILENSSVRFSFCLILTASVFDFFSWINCIWPGRITFLLVISSLSLFIPVLFLIGRLHPNLLFEMQEAAKSVRYESSKLKGFDLDQLNIRIESALNRNKGYLNENFSLTDLANELEITTHQLSEFVNVYKNVNFAGFINEYRIREACERLLREPKKNVLTIAYEVGFGAKSSFNLAFLRHTGKTPSAYRKLHLGNSDL